VKNLTFDVAEGAIISLIGPNGAGKSTVFNLITGIYRPTSGSIGFAGRDITNLKPNAVADFGIMRTFQNIRLFAYMTVLENVLVGRHCRTREGVLSAIGEGARFDLRPGACRSQRPARLHCCRMHT